MDVVLAMAESGADFIELQIPFSDPMADGPTIMSANEAALETGVRPKDCLKAMEKLAGKTDVPLLFMSYFNLVFAYGGGKGIGGNQDSVAHFCRDASNAGATGLIVPDVPPEENNEGYWTTSKEYNLLPVPLVSPVTSDKRLKSISKACGDDAFVYCVATTGTTGARKALPKELAEYLGRVRKVFSQPLAVGFGISEPAHVEALGKHADIAIVGSAMIDKISNSSARNRLASVRKFTRELRGA
jgi:tryptophan synthase alpha subunit